MKRKMMLAALAISLVLSTGAAASAAGNATVLRFGTMYGVDGPFLGSTNAIRGVSGDNLPWEIPRVQGLLTADGRLIVTVKGLVFKSEDPVPPDLQGINDAPEFRALVSCLTETPQDTVVVENVTTQGFPATRSGDSFINEKLDLPNPCVAPIVFILPGDEDDWFAVTGVETGD